MSGRGGYGLWLAATAGSVALHGAIGITLYAMPMPEPHRPPPTEIRFETPDIGAAAPLSPQTQAPSMIPRVTAAAVDASAPASATAIEASAVQSAAPAETKADASEPTVAQAVAAQSLAPIAIEPSAPDMSASRTVEPSAESQALAEVGTEALPPSLETDVATSAALSEAAAAASAAPEIAPATRPEATPPVPDASTAVASVDQSVAAAVDADPSLTVESNAPQPMAPVAARAEPRTPAPLEVPPVSELSPAPVAPPTKPPVVDASGMASAPAIVKPSRVEATGPVDPASRPVATIPPPASASTASTVVAAQVKPQAPAAVPNVVAPSTSAQASDQQVAVILQPTIETGGDDKDTARPGRLRIGDFLSSREDDDCLLALPTSMGAQQASIEAFAIHPESVSRLGTDYEKESGVSLRADTRAVSESQCSALSFARSLAAYPNFPLRLTLNESSIRSGSVLSGVISGLRKSTLYLVVVDDEGKAELMDANLDVRSTITSFRAPMTLTSGPVSSVQLLVAIASDGPLETVPRRPGIPAEDYFSRLATEIVMGQRSIAYGITSFEVR